MNYLEKSHFRYDMIINIVRITQNRLRYIKLKEIINKILSIYIRKKMILMKNFQLKWLIINRKAINYFKIINFKQLLIMQHIIKQLQSD